jgi:hypothetical protein
MSDWETVIVLSYCSRCFTSAGPVEGLNYKVQEKSGHLSDYQRRAAGENLERHGITATSGSRRGAGAPLITIAPLLGHSSTVMTARYAHLSDRMLREATDKAGKLLAAPDDHAETRDGTAAS